MDAPAIGELAERARSAARRPPRLPRVRRPAETEQWLAAREPRRRRAGTAGRGTRGRRRGPAAAAALPAGTLAGRGGGRARAARGAGRPELGGLARVWLGERGAPDVPAPAQEMVFWLTVDTIAAQLAGGRGTARSCRRWSRAGRPAQRVLRRRPGGSTTRRRRTCWRRWGGCTRTRGWPRRPGRPRSRRGRSSRGTDGPGSRERGTAASVLSAVGVQLPFPERRAGSTVFGRRAGTLSCATGARPPRRHHAAHPQRLRQIVRDHRRRGGPRRQRRCPRHRPAGPSARTPGAGPDGAEDRGTGSATARSSPTRTASSRCPPGFSYAWSPTPAGPGWSPASPPRPTTTARRLRRPARRDAAGQQPRAEGPARRLAAPGAAHRGPGLRPGGGRRLHRRRGPPAAPRSPSGWASPAPPPTAPAAAPRGAPG